jgi:hypothetical protein
MQGMEVAAAVSAGGVFGYLWHRLAGCSGACPIVRSPYLSVIWGALVGLLFTVQ